MRSKGFDGMVCSIAGVMSAIGARWGLVILRDLVLGLRRYEDFRYSSGVTNATLSDRLKHLEAGGREIRRKLWCLRPSRRRADHQQRGAHDWNQCLHVHHCLYAAITLSRRKTAFTLESSTVGSNGLRM